MTLADPVIGNVVRDVRSVAVLLPVFIDTAIKGSFVLALCALAARWARRSSAAGRHAIWTAGILGHLFLPVFTWYAPPIYWQVLPAPPWLTAANGFSSTGDLIPHDRAAQVLALCAVLWLTGVLVLLARIVTAWFLVTRLGHDCRAAANETFQPLAKRITQSVAVRPRIALLYHPGIAVPIAWGVFSPRIVLPAALETWSETELEAILAHEIEHIRRHDVLTQLAAQVTLALFWFDPLLWMAARRMRYERELACDDAVVLLGIDRWKYAEGLLRAARELRERQIASNMLAAITGDGLLEIDRRIRALLDPSTDRHSPRTAAWITAVLILLLFELPLGALRPFRWNDSAANRLAPPPEAPRL